MKKIICIALCWPLMQVYRPAFAQKPEPKENKSEIIIMKNGDKDEKLTIETKNGETLINGKPASEYKGDDIKVITGKDGNNYVFSSGSNNMNWNNNMNYFNGEKRAFLGVTTEKTDNGVKITNVENQSAADKAGLKVGDVITMVGSKKISDPEDLSNAVTSHKPTEEIKIAFDRNGKSENTKAVLGETLSESFFYNQRNTKVNENVIRNYNRSFNFKMPQMNLSQTAPFALIRNGGGRHFGVRIEDADNNEGAKVTNVQEGSIADKAGVKKDDIITDVNGKKVKDVNEVVEQIRASSDKDSYTLKAKRGGSEINFDIKIPKRKNNADL